MVRKSRLAFGGLFKEFCSTCALKRMTVLHGMQAGCNERTDRSRNDRIISKSSQQSR